ncbi:MAG: hypothetical protein AAGI48_11385 [Verrucomicrobiota bacterium]
MKPRFSPVAENPAAASLQRGPSRFARLSFLGLLTAVMTSCGPLSSEIADSHALPPAAWPIELPSPTATDLEYIQAAPEPEDYLSSILKELPWQTGQAPDQD